LPYRCANTTQLSKMKEESEQERTELKRLHGCSIEKIKAHAQEISVELTTFQIMNKDLEHKLNAANILVRSVKRHLG
jgi:hypothetical protein